MVTHVEELLQHLECPISKLFVVIEKLPQPIGAAPQYPGGGRGCCALLGSELDDLGHSRRGGEQVGGPEASRAFGGSHRPGSDPSRQRRVAIAA